MKNSKRDLLMEFVKQLYTKGIYNAPRGRRWNTANVVMKVLNLSKPPRRITDAMRISTEDILRLHGIENDSITNTQEKT